MHQFMTLDTLEERINDQIHAKRTLADPMVGTEGK